MVTYTRAQTVAPGDPITSTQLRSQALAFNDRFRQGPDCGWRLVFYLFSLFRNMRNGDGDLFPSEAEFFHVYQMLDPALATWPVAGPGEPQGARLDSMMPAYVFGAETAGLTDEATRLSDANNGGVELWIDGGSPVTDLQKWELAKLQRGAIGENGELASPSFTAARSHFALVPSPRSKHGNSYGGFMPSPDLVGTPCGDGPPPSPNFIIFFTNLHDHSTVSYPGTCPDTAGHVAGVYQSPFAFYVFIVGGGVDIYRLTDWVEGPYTGGSYLVKQSGNMLARVVNNFASEFRGTEAQRATGGWNQFATDNQRFFTTQYHLSPERGHVIDETSIAPDYPLFTFGGADTLPDGTVAPYAHTIASGFVVPSLLVNPSGLNAPVFVEAMLDGAVIATFPATPNVSNIFMLPTVATAGLLQFRLKGEASFSAGGKLEIECAELYEYKPQIYDWFLFERLGAARTDYVNGTDGSGLEETRANVLSDSYFASGCLINLNEAAGIGGTTDAINQNAVFDSARRLSQIIRIVPRQNFRGYAVEDGKSVCWFARHAIGLDTQTEVDLFAGIADSIAHVAPPQGWTNQWLMGHQFKAYYGSDSSAFKPDSFADYFFLSDRCHFLHDYFVPQYNGLHPDLKDHFDYGEPFGAAPEAPTSFRYIHGVNSGSSKSRYESCRIMEPDPEIESAVSYFENGVEMVRIGFKTRFHHADTAPAAIARDVSTWDTAALAVEAAISRTVENGLREYLVYNEYGINCQPDGEGNSADGVTPSTVPVRGACFPHFYFVKLAELPYEDGNDVQNGSDTPFFHDQLKLNELRLRAMCEGFVDGTTSVSIGCSTLTPSLFDFTYENLCYEAFGGRWINGMPQTATDYIPASDTRPDNMQGFGPPNNTKASSEIFNQISLAVNRLTKVRIALPMSFEIQQYGSAINSEATTQDLGDPCGGFAFGAATVAPTELPVALVTPWAAFGYAASTTLAKFEKVCAGAGAYDLTNFRNDMEYHYLPTDPNAYFAIPENWRDMLSTNGQMLATVTTNVETNGIEIVAPADAQLCGGVALHDAAGNNYREVLTTTATSKCQIVPSVGYVAAEPIGRNSFMRFNAGGAIDCQTVIQNDKAITPILNEDNLIEVPLVDL